MELYVPHGPKISYALLGAELIEAEADGLQVHVLVNKSGSVYNSSLAAKVDQVKVGCWTSMPAQ